MDPDFARYDDLVHAVYDAALDPARWPAALAGIADACGSDRSVLFTPAHSPAQGGFVFSHNLSQANIERWAAKSRLEDPLVHAATARGLFREGAALDGDDLVPRETLLATPFYRELWAPFGIGRACSGVIFDGTDARKLPAVVSVFRRPDDAPFGARQLDLIRRLVAHLSRALGVMFHLRDHRLQAASTLAALDRLPAGVVLLDARGGITFTNVAARRMLRSGDVLALAALAEAPPRAEHLVLAGGLRGRKAEFQRAIARALSPLGIGADGHFSHAMVLPDAQGRPACVLHAAPLGRAPAGAAVSGGAIVLLYDLTAASSVAPELLCELFQLTPAEARSALQVLHGGSLAEMARRAGVGVATFKTQLQVAYAKTQTHRRVDLLKLLLALAAA